ncbi:MAG: ABC transporter substrate-binding protein [Chitinophagaceae bacterium]
MKIKIVSLFIISCMLFMSLPLQSQNNNAAALPSYKIGLFAPLYLDSIFTDNNFKYKQGFPKFILPALDFVQGAEIALDSMSLDNAHLKVNIYDSRSYKESISYLVKSKRLDSLDLIIGSVKDADYKQLADFALAKNIPFISATYPNDGGITGNPFTLIINSTLKSHCEAIYSYILQNHGTDKIYLVRQKGAQEDKIAAYFSQLNEQEGRPLLNIQTILFDSIGAIPKIVNKLDSNRQNVLIGGSLDENFAGALAKTCQEVYHSYSKLTLIGMPNWYSFKVFNNKEVLKDFPVYYTSPYWNAKLDSFSKVLTNAYAIKFKTKPSDMAFKGFEAMHLFSTLLIKHPNDLMSNLNDKTCKVFCDYTFKPVLLKKGNASPDYFENKHLYFIRILNGTESKAW